MDRKTQPLRVLLVEDNEADAELMLRELRRAGFEPEWQRVETEAEFLRHLHADLDLILSDYAMPQFSGLRALELLNERQQEIPFIIVSGTIGEETAVAAMRSGAADYLLKDRLARLGQAIEQALEQKRLRRERKEARETQEEAERASRAKSEFLSRMSHELRTPLNAILGFSQILELDATRPEDQESITHIIDAGRHLLDLINEILDIAQIEAGRISIMPECVAVADLMEDCVALIQPLAQQRGIRINRNFPADTDQHVKADRQRLKQVLINLLSNGVKYNRENGTVALSLEASEGDSLRIKVTDTGRGISAEDAARLFMPFERLQHRTGDVEGTGLGLALSKRLVELMGGSIGFESEPGQGTLFWLDLPLIVPATPADETTHDRIKLADVTNVQTVVHIEDDPSITRLVQQILRRRPHLKVLPAREGRLGIELAREHQAAAILLDLGLPDTRGEELLIELQQDARTQQIPVLIISVVADAEHIARLLASGVRGYLPKPLDVPTFLAAMDALLPSPTATQ